MGSFVEKLCLEIKMWVQGMLITTEVKRERKIRYLYSNTYIYVHIFISVFIYISIHLKKINLSKLTHHECGDRG